MRLMLTKKQGVLAAKGYQANGITVGKTNQQRVALVVSESPAQAAGVFTQNQFPAAPVIAAKKHLRLSKTHSAVLINAGSANACGKSGIKDVKTICYALSEKLNLKPKEILVASTGVIGTSLPVASILKGLAPLVKNLSQNKALSAARSIMTTDTVPKQVETSFTFQGTKIRLGGMAKGAGMICPNMATMLGLVTTDAKIARQDLQKILGLTTRTTFNTISVDAQTSTNDTVFLLANGAAGLKADLNTPAALKKFQAALYAIMEDLAIQIVRDGEGASKFVEIIVKGAKSEKEADLAARAIGDSMLVKAAIHGQDPKWGRIMQALGASPVKLQENKINMAINKVSLVKQGIAVVKLIPKAKKVMQAKDIVIEVNLGLGKKEAKYRTTDLTPKYVTINKSK